MGETDKEESIGRQGVCAIWIERPPSRSDLTQKTDRSEVRNLCFFIFKNEISFAIYGHATENGRLALDLHRGRFFEKIKIQTFRFQKNVKKFVQVNKDVMCMCVKFQDEIR